MNLRALFHRHFPVFKADLTNINNRRIADKHDLTKVRAVVIPCVRFDPDTGEIINWGVWTQDQNFQGDVDIDGDLDVGGALNVTGVTTLLLEIILEEHPTPPAASPVGTVAVYCADIPGAGSMGMYIVDDGGLLIELHPTECIFPVDVQIGQDLNVTRDIDGTDITASGDLESGDDVIVGDDLDVGGEMLIDGYIRMQDGQRLYISHTTTSYFAYSTNMFRLYVGATQIMAANVAGVYYYMNLVVTNPGYLILQERAAGLPGGAANYGKIVCINNAGQTELWFIDDTGGQHEIAFV